PGPRTTRAGDEVLNSHRVWAEQYVGAPGQLRWREVKEMPSPAELISSPYDTDARYSTKRDVEWVGYKVCHATPSWIAKIPTTGLIASRHWYSMGQLLSL